MTVYGLYIFDRHCACIHHSSWNQKQSQTNEEQKEQPQSRSQQQTSPTSSPKTAEEQETPSVGGLVGVINGPSKEIEEQSKLVYGVVFSLRNIVSKLSNKEGEQFRAFKTSTYKLHYFESGSGVRFVLVTDPSLDHQADVLFRLFSQIYVEYVSKNPLYFGGWIDSEQFKLYLQRFVRALPFFA